MSSFPPPPPPPPPPPLPPPPAEAPTAAEKAAQDNVAEACRKLEIARGQEAELEALLVFASTVLEGNEREDLPESIQDVYQEVRNIYPEDEIKEKVFPPPGQFGKAVETQMISSAIHSAAQQAADVFTNRLTEGPALDSLVGKIRKENLQHQLSSPGHHMFLPVLDKRLTELRLYHARHGTNDERQKGLRLASDGFDLGARARQDWLSPIVNDTLFSAAEVLGKYLDLQRNEWISTIETIVKKDTKEEETWDYLDFLQVLAKGLGSLEESQKLAHRRSYERFLVQLESYLVDYLKRTTPLLDVKKEIIAPVIKQSIGTEVKGIDLTSYDSAESLQKAVDPDALKTELMRLGLKCGGTPTDRARRLWITKGKEPSEWPAKIKAKGATAATSASAESSHAAPQGSVSLAQREAVLTALLDQVRPSLEATIKRMERQQGQTLAERETEINEDMYGSAVPVSKKRKTEDDDDDEDDDTPVYNPKNVPLDWDGKPIPYWLFKLHGLQHVRSWIVMKLLCL